MTFYSRLTQREVIRPGDEIYQIWGEWEPVNPEHIGKRKGEVYKWPVKMRRPAKNLEEK